MSMQAGALAALLCALQAAARSPAIAPSLAGVTLGMTFDDCRRQFPDSVEDDPVLSWMREPGTRVLRLGGSGARVTFYGGRAERIGLLWSGQEPAEGAWPLMVEELRRRYGEPALLEDDRAAWSDGGALLTATRAPGGVRLQLQRDPNQRTSIRPSRLLWHTLLALLRSLARQGIPWTELI